MGDWADEKAREWMATAGLLGGPKEQASLAALLREVDNVATTRTLEEQGLDWKPSAQVGRETTLAEVRRVVLEQRPPGPVWPEKRAAERAICDEILSRLDAL